MTTTTETLDFTEQDLKDIADRAREGIALKAKTSLKHKEECVQDASLRCTCGAWEAHEDYVAFIDYNFPLVAQGLLDRTPSPKMLELARKGLEIEAKASVSHTTECLRSYSDLCVCDKSEAMGELYSFARLNLEALCRCILGPTHGQEGVR